MIKFILFFLDFSNLNVEISLSVIYIYIYIYNYNILDINDFVSQNLL